VKEVEQRVGVGNVKTIIMAVEHKDLKKVVGELEGAVKAHGKQAETIEQHIEDMESPAPFKMSGFPVHSGISPMAFKGADSSNSSCWKGYRKVGTKKSPSGTGKTVNDCEKI